LEGIEMKKFIATLVVAAFSMSAALAQAAPAVGNKGSVISVQHGKHKKGTHKKHKRTHKKLHHAAK
jgi:opacity protein-like surface antigen